MVEKIITKTKDQFTGRHLRIRCIEWTEILPDNARLTGLSLMTAKQHL